MTHCRLLSSFTLTSSTNTLRVGVNSGAATTVTIPAVEYFWSCHSADPIGDFATALKTALETVFPAYTFTVGLYGVNNTDSSKADGMVRIEIDTDDFKLFFTDGAWTLDPRILGMDGDADTGWETDWASDWVHRFGWYPQTNPKRCYFPKRQAAAVSFGSDYLRDVVRWGARRQTAEILFDFIQPCFLTDDEANTAAMCAGSNIATGDQNCSLESFGLDLTDNADTSEWRFYEVATTYNSITSWRGPFTWPPESELWEMPTALAPIVQDAGQVHGLALNGIEAET